MKYSSGTGKNQEASGEGTASLSDDEQRALFLETVLGPRLPDGLWAHVWHLADERTDWVRGAQEADRLATSDGRRDVYLGGGLARAKGHSYERVRAATAAGMLGVVADLDIADPVHDETALPPDVDAALALLDELGLAPTLVVHSGHGLHCWWLYAEPWRFASEEDRERAVRLGAAWQAHVSAVAARHGWKVDPVGDLARILRVPGTLNAKVADAVVEVRLLRYTPDARYTPADVAAVCGEEAGAGDGAGEDGPVGGGQRFTRAHPCPICGGYKELPAGEGRRCYGFATADGQVAFCTRREHAGDLEPVGPLGSYIHHLRGTCGCGKTHGEKQRRLNLRDSLDTLVDATVAALGRAHDPQRGHVPSVVVRGGKLTCVRVNEAERPALVLLDAAALAVEIDRVVDFGYFVKKKQDDGTEKMAFAPQHPRADVVLGVLRAANHGVPPLVGITEVPVLRPDGTVLATPGYDPATHLLYWPAAGARPVPPVSESPTDAELAAAVALLREAVGDFPYREPADLANEVATLLGPVARPAIAGLLPLALYEAPKPGTGKGLLAAVTATLAVGHTAGVMTQPTEPAEWDKVITTALLAGHPVNIFDNVTGLLDSDRLAAVLTADVWKGRLLGKNDAPELPNRAVWIVTGNNIRLGPDIARRA